MILPAHHIISYYYSYRKASEIKFAIEERDPIKIAQFYVANGQLATMEELEVS